MRRGTMDGSWWRAVVLAGLVVVVAEATTGLSTEDFTQSLLWAPLHLRKPYMTFINDFHNPTWRTRHPITKDYEAITHLYLPRGVPFAVICGACFHRARSTTNLTVSLAEHAFNAARKQRPNKKFEYNVNHIECLMTYVVTEPLFDDDVVTCTLTRGHHTTTERLAFTVQDVDVAPPHEVSVGEDEGDVLHLVCPQPEVPPSLANPLVAVWHEPPQHPTNDEHHHVTRPIATMLPSLTLSRPTMTREVVCTVYHIANPVHVNQTLYRITGTLTAAAKTELRVSGGVLELHEDTEEIAPSTKLSNAVLGLVLTSVAVGVLLTAIAVYRIVVATRDR